MTEYILINNFSLHSGGSLFKSRSGDQLFSLLVFTSPSKDISRYILKYTATAFDVS